MAPTQDALYRDLDLELSWSERELPERERTKHVHRLHPYLGKFSPQLVEALLARYFAAGGRVLPGRRWAHAGHATRPVPPKEQNSSRAEARLALLDSRAITSPAPPAARRRRARNRGLSSWHALVANL